jgi:hypothetical protein
MPTDPNLYSPRERQWNIDLIRTVVFAPDRASSEAGRTEFARNLHPSLFAELDWMERTIPEPQRERAAEIVDDLFLDTLAKNIASRHSQFDLDEALLAMELDSSTR